MGCPSESGRARRTGVASRIARLSVLTLALLGLPLLGVALQGKPISQYLEFPPKTRYVTHASFSWLAFWACTAVTGGFVAPFVRQYLRTRWPLGEKLRPQLPFPWWGWLGLGFGLSAWVLAWTRFPWFSTLQPHTFTPLWLSFILVVNGLSWRRSGRCLMIHRTRFFLLLFPLSGILWWFFEYLNRFVQNWVYATPGYSGWEYVLYATIPFTTVLPAVLSLEEWLLCAPGIERAYSDFRAAPWALRRDVATVILLAAAAGLAGIGIWPGYLFPLLWLSPLLMGVSLETLCGEPQVLSSALGEGDWRVVVSSALAALICGWFWEMWNFYSLSKWHYSIPFVHRFEIFEMPILGYGGYLPFGITCAFVAELLEGSSGRGGGTI
jgi:hypothetical protein